MTQPPIDMTPWSLCTVVAWLRTIGNWWRQIFVLHLNFNPSSSMGKSSSYVQVFATNKAWRVLPFQFQNQHLQPKLNSPNNHSVQWVNPFPNKESISCTKNRSTNPFTLKQIKEAISKLWTVPVDPVHRSRKTDQRRYFQTVDSSCGHVHRSRKTDQRNYFQTLHISCKIKCTDQGNPVVKVHRSRNPFPNCGQLLVNKCTDQGNQIKENRSKKPFPKCEQLL